MAIQHTAARGRENFPVASFLLPKKARQQILSFYDFARGADELADAEDLSGQERLEALEMVEDAIDSRHANRVPPWAKDYYHVIHSGQFSPDYGKQLMQAFKQDCVKQRYETWEELLDYCRYSAAPVGRAVLEMSHETQADYPAADALCMALQLINHWQDMQEDFQQLNRIYLPQEWVGEPLEALLVRDEIDEELDAALRRLEQEISTLLEQAHALLPTLRSARLRTEVRWMLAASEKLVKKLHNQKRWSQKVTLSKWQKLTACWRALWLRRAHR